MLTVEGLAELISFANELKANVQNTPKYATEYVEAVQKKLKPDVQENTPVGDSETKGKLRNSIGIELNGVVFNWDLTVTSTAPYAEAVARGTEDSESVGKTFDARTFMKNAANWQNPYFVVSHNSPNSEYETGDRLFKFTFQGQEAQDYDIKGFGQVVERGQDLPDFEALANKIFGVK